MKFRTFDKSDRSSFPYWYNHWKAFNYTAFKLHVWHPRFLLHDILKPWLMLIWRDYDRVQKWHRYHSRHHIEAAERLGIKRFDTLAMVIDNECSRLTKKSAQMTAIEFLEKKRTTLREHATLWKENPREFMSELAVYNRAIEKAKEIGLKK